MLRSVVIGALAFGGLFFLGDSPMAGQPTREATRVPADVAMLLAARGQSAGMVLPLPAHLEDALERAKHRSDVFPNDREAFAVWLTESGQPKGLSRSSNGETPEEVFEAYARANPRSKFVISSKSGGSRAAVLRDESAGVCHGVLQRRTSMAHSSRDVVELVSSVAADVTGSEPRGWAGGCVGPNQFSTVPRVVGPGVRLGGCTERHRGAI